MSVFQFELATDKDDVDLQSILAQTPMDGKISLSFRREPSYFDALSVEGKFCQIVAARNQTDGRLVGFGTRSITNKYVNQIKQPVGYLSNLRLLKKYRGINLIARGYRYFKQLHQDNRTPFYLTTIAEGNQNAINLLTSKRVGLPNYHKLGKYYTLAIPLKQRQQASKDYSKTLTSIRPADIADKPKIIEFLLKEGAKRDFFPNYQEEDLFNDSGLLKGLKPKDLLLAIKDHHIVGLLAAWNQQPYKQTIVEKYSRGLSLMKPYYNTWAKIVGHPKLPNPGQQVRYLTAALPLVKDNQLKIFQTLLQAQLNACSGGIATHLMIGMHESDPLREALKSTPGIQYTTNLYLVSWEDDYSKIYSHQSKNNIIYLELGSL